MSGRRIAVRGVIVIAIICDTIRRMVEGARPVDWVMIVIEALVLILICAEYAERKWLERRRHNRLSQLHGLLTEGQEIQGRAIPAGTTDEAAISSWNDSVGSWIIKTNNYLTGLTPRASAAFLHNRGGAGINYSGVTGKARDHFVMLLARLNNLQSIMEKPEVYL